MKNSRLQISLLMLVVLSSIYASGLTLYSKRNPWIVERTIPASSSLNKIRLSNNKQLVLIVAPELQLIDSSSLLVIAKFQEHRGDVFDATFSPDDRQFLSVGSDGFIVLYDVAERKVVRKWKAHDSMIYQVRFSHDGRYMATCSVEGDIKVWDGANYSELFSWKVSEDLFAVEIAWASTRLSLVYTSRSGKVGQIDLKIPLKDSLVTRRETKSYATAMFELDYDHYVFGDKDGNIHKWSLTERELTETVNIQKDAVDCITLHQFPYILTSSFEGTVQLIDVRGFRVRETFTFNNHRTVLSLSNGVNAVFTRGDACFFDLNSSRNILFKVNIAEQNSTIHDAQLINDGRTMIVTSDKTCSFLRKVREERASGYLLLPELYILLITTIVFVAQLYFFFRPSKK